MSIVSKNTIYKPKILNGQHKICQNLAKKKLIWPDLMFLPYTLRFLIHFKSYNYINMHALDDFHWLLKAIGHKLTK